MLAATSIIPRHRRLFNAACGFGVSQAFEFERLFNKGHVLHRRVIQRTTSNFPKSYALVNHNACKLQLSGLTLSLG